MEILTIILGLVTAHIFGDYVFQSLYIAERKNKDVYHLIVHCWIYTFCIWCALTALGRFNIYIIVLVFISHMIIDFIKPIISKKIGEKAYFLDQMLHYIIIALVFILIR